MTALMVPLFLIVAILLLWQFSNILSIVKGVPPVMTNKKLVKFALKKAGLKMGEVFYDLGCGNGQVLIEAAKRGARAIGFEISPYYYLVAKIRTSKFKNIEVYYKDFRELDFKKADIIFCYLLPKVLKKLIQRFNKLEKGARLISIGFPISRGNKFLVKKYIFKKRAFYIYKKIN